jgi:hypothetical protein
VILGGTHDVTLNSAGTIWRKFISSAAHISVRQYLGAPPHKKDEGIAGGLSSNTIADAEG